MPIYEYRCDNCGFQKEYIQRMSDPLLTDCPECKKATFNKMVTAAGFQLKGGGWYVTDFKGSGSNSASIKKTEEKQSDTSAKPESAAAPASTPEKSKSEAAPSTTPASSGTP
jgi:putative FmdB family regulatory protein